MVLTSKDLMNELYDAALITGGAVVTSMAIKKLTKDNMGIQSTIQSVLKLTVLISSGTLLVKYLQDKKFIPVDPFKDSS